MSRLWHITAAMALAFALPNASSAAPVVEFLLGEGSGSGLADASFNGNTGQFGNGAVGTTTGGQIWEPSDTPLPDATRFAIRFDANDLVRVEDSSTLDTATTGPFTIEFWIKVPAVTSGSGATIDIAQKWLTNTLDRSFALSLIENGGSLRPRLLLQNAANNGRVTIDAPKGASIQAGRWTHCAVVNDGSQVIFYRDGVGHAATTPPIPCRASANRLFVGGSFVNKGTEFLLGDFRLHAGALDAFAVWQSFEASSRDVAGDFIPVTPNRNYTISARVRGAEFDPDRVLLYIRQYPVGFDVPDRPNLESLTLTEPDGDGWRTLTANLYVRDGNDRIVISRRTIGDLQGLEWEAPETVTGGGDYVPTFAAANGEYIPSAIPGSFYSRNAAQAWVEASGGRARLMVDANDADGVSGTPEPLAMYRSPITSGTGVGLFNTFRTRAGVRIHNRAVLSEYIAPLKGKVFWTGANTFNTAKVDEQIERVLKGDPDGLIILNVSVDPYMDWAVENPNDICLNHEGKKAVTNTSGSVSRWQGSGDAAPDPATERYGISLYSANARADISAMLTALVNHVEQGPYARAVIGYQLQGFGDKQFVPWAHNSTSVVDDYSPAALAAFRAWLRIRYNNDVNALRAAWGGSSVTFDNASIPSIQRRQGQTQWLIFWTDGPLWMNNTFNDVADWNRFLAEGIAAAVSEWAGVVKARVAAHTDAPGNPRRKIVQTYYAGPMAGAMGGLALEQYLASPDIDVFQAPADYWLRLPGYSGGSHAMDGSLRLHNKLYLTEQDWRSWRTSSSAPNESNDIFVGRALTASAHNQIVRRDSGNALAKGTGACWLDIEANSMNDTSSGGIMSGINEARAAFADDLLTAEAPRADVAVFVGERSLDFLKWPEGNSYRWFILRRNRDLWDKSGVPYHVYLQSDVAHADLPDYKVYVFACPEHLTAAERTAIGALKSAGRTLVFLHAADIIGQANPDAAMSAITGMTVATVGTAEDEEALEGTFAGGIHPLLRNLGGSFGDQGVAGSFPDTQITAQAWRVNDASTTPIAYYKGTSNVAIAARDFGSWKSIFCGVPKLTPRFLNNIAKWAGAWVAAEPWDAVFASQRFATIHALSGGTKQIRLVQPARVTDLTSGAVISNNASSINLDMATGETRWFKLGPPVTTSRDAWLYGHFTEAQILAQPSVTSWDADPDADSVRNLMEYAGGLDPLVPGPSGGFFRTGSITDSGSASYLEFYQRRNLAADDIVRTFEQSTTLAGWTSVTPEFLGSTPVEEGIVEDRYRVEITNEPRLFLRANISTTP